MSPFGSATLLLNGPTGKLRFEIQGDKTTVGRTRDNEIVLQDPAVSSHHCEFIAEPVGLVLRDLNSSNGSYVNGRRVVSGPVYDGDMIKLGQFQGRIQVRAADGTPLKAPGSSKTIWAIAALLFVLAIAGAIVVVKVHESKKAHEAEVEAFEDYDKLTMRYLKIDACDAADNAARALRQLDPDLQIHRLEFPKNGRPLGPTEKKSNEERLRLMKLETGIVAKVLEELTSAIPKQEKAFTALREANKFQEPTFREIATDLEATFAKSKVSAAALKEELANLAADLEKYNRALEGFITAKPADKGARDAIEGLQVRPYPAKRVEECKEDHAKSIEVRRKRMDEAL